MKKTIVLLYVFVGIVTQAKADTIDYWRAYYNGVEISDFQIVDGRRTLKFEYEKIRDLDSITLKYFTDTPNSAMNGVLTAHDEEHYSIFWTHCSLDKNRYLMRFKYILLNRNLGKATFDVYFSTSGELYDPKRIFLFQIIAF